MVLSDGGMTVAQSLRASPAKLGGTLSSKGLIPHQRIGSHAPGMQVAQLYECRSR